MMPKLKILHITRSTELTGGCEIYIRNLIAEFLERQHEIFAVAAENPTNFEKEFNFSPHCIPFLASLEHKTAREASRELEALLLKLSPDLIHIHDLNNPYAIELCAKKFPTVKTTLNADAYCGGIDKYLYASKKSCEYRLGYGCLAIAYHENYMKRHPRRGLEIISIKKRALAACRDISHLIVPSESSKQIMVQNRVPGERISVIPLFARFQNQRNLVSYPRRLPPKILFLGRLRPYKGVSFLLEALKKIKIACELIIVGDGDERKSLEELCLKLDISGKVHFAGNQPHDKIGQYLDECSLVAVPSIYPDSFPTVGLEAMARARPVVGFRIGGIPEWLTDGRTGFLVEPQDTNALAQKISFLLEHPDTAEEMGRQGYRVLGEKFTADVHFKKISALYHDAIGSFKRECVSTP